MSIQKQLLKSRPACKVKFRVPKDRADGAERVSLVGDFNNWDAAATPMDQLKNGDYTAVLYLDPDQSYEFRYLVDGIQWINDEEADHFAPTPYPDVHNSVILT